MLRFLILFLLLQVTLFSFEMMPWAQQWLVLPWTNALANISAWLMQWLDTGVVTFGKVIQSTQNQFAISIEAGCNGIEAMIVLLAAILAFPSSWTYKLLGLLWGFIAIQGINLVRIVSLFYLGQWNYTWFEWAHLYIWQALIMLDALIVFLIWVRYLPSADSMSERDMVVKA